MLLVVRGGGGGGGGGWQRWLVDNALYTFTHAMGYSRNICSVREASLVTCTLSWSVSCCVQVDASRRNKRCTRVVFPVNGVYAIYIIVSDNIVIKNILLEQFNTFIPLFQV